MGMTSSKQAAVSVFFVFKMSDELGWALRPVWDLRKVNLCFQQPPRIRLGSPCCLAELDLSSGVSQGKVLHAAWGDIPDFFHRCGTPASVWPWMVWDPISPKQLASALARRGDPPLRLGPDDRFLALCVAPMGWTWAPALCHGALEEILGNECEGFPLKGQLVYGSAVPSFLEQAYLYWVYMDDFASFAMLPP